MKTKQLIAVLALALALPTFAHDSWLQPNTNTIRPGDAIYLDLMLGNHGNEHRDFKLAGKASLDAATAEVISPDGKHYDLKPSAVDQGYAPKEGYWSLRFTPEKPGLYVASYTSDKVVDYAPKRSVHSAKTFFLVSKSLDNPTFNAPGYDRVLGHPLELVPQSHPVTPMGPGAVFKVQLLYKGKPLAGEKVSFIPRGQALTGTVDPNYERTTDANGIASLELKEPNLYLVVAHHDSDEKGANYDSTKYSATLTLFVPAICPCCAE